MKLTEDFKEMLTAITNQINTLKSSPTQKDSLKALDPPTMVLANRRATSLFGGKSKNIGSMWTLKHDISSPKFYELLIKIELKVCTDLDLNNFYNHIEMCLNAVTRL